jgi:hypothetical protein
LAIVHRGERVLNPEQTKEYDSGDIKSVQITVVDIDKFAKLMEQGMRVGSGYSPTEQILQNGRARGADGAAHTQPVNVVVENTYNGITHENFLRDQARRETALEGKIISRVNEEGLKSRGGRNRFSPLG